MNDDRARTAALSVADVSKRFGPVEVLRELTLTVETGEVCVLLGPSGCGKTTLLRTVAGFERLDRGVVRIGSDVVDDGRRYVPPERRGVGVVPQEGALFPHLDVAGNVGFGVVRAERAARVAECLHMVGLAGYESARPSELSGGQQQRVAVARALAPRPKLLLLDEPFAALDANLRASVRDELVGVIRAARATVVLVTHDRDEALAVADRVGVILAGSLRQMASPVDVYRAPADAEVAALVGDVCLLQGQHRNGRVHTALGALVTGRNGTGAGRSGGGADGDRDDDVLVVVRPEQVALRVVSGADADDAVGSIERLDYYGHDGVAHVALDAGSKVQARVPGHDLPKVGDRVVLTVSGDVSIVNR